MMNRQFQGHDTRNFDRGNVKKIFHDKNCWQNVNCKPHNFHLCASLKLTDKIVESVAGKVLEFCRQ